MTSRVLLCHHCVIERGLTLGAIKEPPDARWAYPSSFLKRWDAGRSAYTRPRPRQRALNSHAQGMNDAHMVSRVAPLLPSPSVPPERTTRRQIHTRRHQRTLIKGQRTQSDSIRANVVYGTRSMSYSITPYDSRRSAARCDIGSDGRCPGRWQGCERPSFGETWCTASESMCEKSYPSRARKEAVRYHPRKTAPSRSRLGFSSRFTHTL